MTSSMGLQTCSNNNNNSTRHYGHNSGCPFPSTIRVMAVIHLACLLLCSLAMRCSAAAEEKSTNCVEESEVRLVCIGLHSTRVFFDPPTGSNLRRVREIVVKDSELTVLDLNHFAGYEELRTLTVSGVKLKSVNWGSSNSLRVLDLSNNELTELLPPPPSSDDASSLSGLRELNLSRNSLTEFVLSASLNGLEVLDLSSNSMDENIDQQIFQMMPNSLKYLDISNNSWSCSPKLEWLYQWAGKRPSVLHRLPETRCHYENSNQHGQLLLLMEYYSLHVLPACPFRDNCSCLLTHLQEGQVTGAAANRVYSVQVNCADSGLTHFPKLPKNTRTVDLSGNRLDGEAFSLLKVKDHNYDEVDNLTLDNNNMESLGFGKLLEMKLKLSFSAKDNRLTSIPYDFSQRLILSTSVIKLSRNPWQCTCGSEITNLNLISKILDKSELVCGPSSILELVNKKIDDLIHEVLCPPESTGEFQELLLQLLCIVFAILIVVIMSKLMYDYWIYRTRGQLPWIVLKMP